jgi:hypothetical protein
MRDLTLTFTEIAATAGHVPGADGKLNLPATQETADALAASASTLLGPWSPGDEPARVTLTGAGPTWGYLCIAHALHGRAVELVYAAPNAPAISVWRHGV